MSIHTWPNGSIDIPTVTAEFGPREVIQTPAGPTSPFHYGIDLVWRPLDYNRSSADGVVTFASYYGGAGNMVKVRHDDGTETTYDHGANGGYQVGVGDRVKRGQPLTVVGATGQATGPHAHYETRNTPGGAAVNPRDFMAAHRTGTAGDDISPLDPRTETIMSLLPAVLHIQNNDANGQPTSAGLAGVFLLLDDDHGYVYPADQLQAVQTVSAPYFNNAIASEGSKIASDNGVPIAISQENLHILLRDLGFPNPGGIVEGVAVKGGGDFWRDAR